MEKVFLDTNILFSYVYSYPKNSLSSLILYLEEKKKIKLFISEIVKQELKLNVKIKIKDKIKIIDTILPRFTVLQDLTFQENFNLPLILKDLPENDKIILTTAIFNKIDFFITGNSKDFNKLYNKKIFNTTILNQRNFLNLMVNQTK